jgi:Tfp pilus assembly protein PilF
MKVHFGYSYLVLFTALLILSGCAGGTTARSPVIPDVEQQVTVTRLEQGLTGFVVAEKHSYSKVQQKLFKLGVDALENGAYDKAAERFQSISEQAPQLVSPHINLAITYIRSGRDEQAEPALKKALEMAAGHPLASHEYGLLLRRNGRFSEARAVYETSLAYYPEYYPLRRNLGVLCDLYLNDLDCATHQYELFLQAQPDDEKVKLWLAEVRERSKY